MADIYVRPYDQSGRKAPKGLLVFALVAILLGSLVWWMMHRRSQEPAQGEAVVTVEKAAQTTPATWATAKSTSVQPVSTKDQNIFSRAQSLVSSGKLLDASRLLDEVISTSTDARLQSNALRMQGRIHVELFFSEAPSPWKKSYVIQPGDSLDRIARRNNTTIELIRRVNGIEGTLIYPGARLQLSAAPFVVEVDKSDRTLDLVMDGKRFKHYSVGLGRFGKTPLGTFHTVVHQDNPDWSPPGGGIIPYGDPLNVLGTRWMSIQDDTRPEIKGFGIHGTADRKSIGSETSNGCIRMLNEDVEEVFLFIPRGTKVVINE